MNGVATAKLATAVTLDGGLGFIGSTGLANIMDIELQRARKIPLDSVISMKSPEMLPLGVDILVISPGSRAWMPVFRSHKFTMT